MMVIDRRYSVLERGEGHRAKQGREGDWEGWGGRITIRNRKVRRASLRGHSSNNKGCDYYSLHIQTGKGKVLDQIGNHWLQRCFEGN